MRKKIVVVARLWMDDEFRAIEAYPLKIDGYEKHEFAIHREILRDGTSKKWVVTEISTGRKVAMGQRTIKEAIQKTIEVLRINVKNSEDLEKIIEQSGKIPAEKAMIAMAKYYKKQEEKNETNSSY